MDMQKTSQKPLYYVVGGIILIIVIAVLFGGDANNTDDADIATTTDEAILKVEDQPTSPAPRSAPPAAVSPPSVEAPRSSVTVVTPTPNDDWKIGIAHEISWNIPLTTSGGIELVDATTGVSHGWIQSSISKGQTSFMWQTRDTNSPRFGATRRNVDSGLYHIRLVFDNGTQPVLSEAFSLTDRDAETVSQVIRLANGAFQPRSLTVSSGTNVILVNSERDIHIISSPTNSFVPITIRPGEMHTINTSVLTKGAHALNSNVYSYRATGNLVVQ